MEVKLRRHCPYRERDLILSEIGFTSYSSYLDSKLWKSIRCRVLRNKTCCCCSGRANQVHHKKYTKSNLTGETLESMVSICQGCHHAAEFTESGKKRKLIDVNAWLALNAVQPKKNRKRRKKKKKCQKDKPTCFQPQHVKLTPKEKSQQKAARKAAAKEANSEKRLILIVKSKISKKDYILLKSPKYVAKGTPIMVMDMAESFEWKNKIAPRNYKFTKVLYNIGECVFNADGVLCMVDPRFLTEFPIA